MLLVLAGTIAMAQIPGVGVGPQQLDNVNVPNIPAMGQQGVNDAILFDNTANGQYNILVNGWISAYARVSAYDNWINFGTMSPISGTYAAPVSRWAVSQVGGNARLLPGEVGGQDPLYLIDGSTNEFDLAGIQIQTNARLDLAIDLGGYMTRCDINGVLFAGNDTRRADNGPYQLRNQVKMNLHGKFLDPLIAAPVLETDAGTAYQSLTTPGALGLTSYGAWTHWGAGAVIPDNNGWIEPAMAAWDPWGGTAAYVTDGGRPVPGPFNLIVERGQAGASGLATAAEIWYTQRVLRRGLQDVAGNYRADMIMTLTYREADAQWNPAQKPVVPYVVTP
jgi:hypothetical protein